MFDMYMDAIQVILRELGIGRNYRGYYRTSIAISMALEDEGRLTAVTKEIYCTTAQQTGCQWTAVERNIRTVIQRAWKVNPQRLIQMAGYPLSSPPTASEFIEIVTNYILRTYGPPENAAPTPEIPPES